MTLYERDKENFQKGYENGLIKGRIIGINEVINKAINEGRHKGKLEIISNFLDVLDDQTLAEKSGIAIEVIQELRKQNQ